MPSDYLILYVGNPAAARSLQFCAEPLGWHIYGPQTPIEALGIYVTCYPHLIVLDGRTDRALAMAVYEQLSSVGAAPMVILDSMPGAWDGLNSPGTVFLSPDQTFEALAGHIDALVDAFPR